MKKILTRLTLATILLTGLSSCLTDQTTLNKICKSSKECHPPYITCQDKTCQHKPLFPLKPKESFGIIVLAILGILVTATGTGGGGLIIPALLFLLDFSTKEAIAISNGVIFFFGSVKFFVGLKKKHPTIRHKTMIDYNVVMVFINSMLIGSFFGSVVAVFVPSVIQISGLVLVVLFAALKSFFKSVKLFERENLNLCRNNNSGKNEGMKKKNGLDHVSIRIDLRNGPKKKFLVKSVLIKDEKNLDLEKSKKMIEAKKYKIPLTSKELNYQQQVRKIESRNFDSKKIAMIILTILTSLIVILLRGGKGLNSIIGVKQCDTLDTTIFLMYASLTAVYCLSNNSIVRYEEELKILGKWTRHQDEIIFSDSFIHKCNILGIFIGFISSIVGIGGGMLLNPMLLHFDIPPQVVSFTAMYLIVINKFISLLVFLLSGLMPVSYLVFIGVVLTCAVIVTEIKLGELIKRYKRQSFISFAFSGLMMVALVPVCIAAFEKIFDRRQGDKGLLEFGSYCG